MAQMVEEVKYKVNYCGETFEGKDTVLPVFLTPIKMARLKCLRKNKNVCITMITKLLLSQQRRTETDGITSTNKITVDNSKMQYEATETSRIAVNERRRVTEQKTRILR